MGLEVFKHKSITTFCTLRPHATYVSANQVHVGTLRSKFSISCCDSAYGLIRFRDFSVGVRKRSRSDLKYLLLLPRRQRQNIPKVTKITWFCWLKQGVDSDLKHWQLMLINLMSHHHNPFRQSDSTPGQEARCFHEVLFLQY